VSGPSWLQRVERGSLHRQYSLSLGLMVGVLVATALICSATVVWAAAHIRESSERVTALQVTNRDVIQGMTDAQTGVRGFILGGGVPGPGSARYETALGHLHADMARLRALAQGDERLLAAVRDQEEANSTWLDEYAARRVAEDVTGMPDSVGDALFRDVRETNETVSARIDEVTADIEEQSSRVLATALAVVVLLPLLVLAAVVVVVRRTGGSVVRPLSHIAGVLERLRAGDVEARAEIRGPLEIRQIAEALNSLTDENLRASEVEADVLSQLESIDRVRTDLVSTVSHELRTPLTSISGYLELLEDDLGALQPQQQAMMEAIRRNLARLNELITNLLALSRAEETQLNVEPVDLRAIATEVAADVRLQATARDVSVRTLQSVAGVVVLADRSQLTRAVQNLVTNAVKFSRPGGVVELRVTQEKCEAVLEVVDEGIGIPLGDLGGLGSRFYRGSNAVRAEIAGTGLGLRIVQTILDRHNGSLSVESVEGEGATFTVRLPISAASGVPPFPAPFPSSFPPPGGRSAPGD
jgi:two-component system, OmpR family, sensor kinase